MTLKECLCCHIYCAHHWPRLAAIDWFWLLGWLINKGEICTRTAHLFWIFISSLQNPRTRLVRKIGCQNQSIYTDTASCAVSNRESRYPPATEGTGTRPDYLVKRVLTKNEGPHPKKIVQKSRNSCRVNSGGVGAHGQLTRSSIGLSPETNTNAQRIIFVSHLLCSPWYPLVPNCWSSPHSC